MVDRIVLAELAWLASFYGPRSVAARALEYASQLDDPEIIRVGDMLIVSERSVEDTIVIRRFW